MFVGDVSRRERADGQADDEIADDGGETESPRDDADEPGDEQHESAAPP